MKIEIYSDGGCTGNPGPGGWAAVLIMENGQTVELSGCDPATTNNRMEMTAVIKALEYLKSNGFPPQTSEVSVTTDSQYLKNGITQWIRGWKKNNWRTASKQPVKNRDLWQILDAVNGAYSPGWHWVKGHSGHAHNERCDALVGKERANAARRRG